MAELTPQETVKAVLNALHSSSADFVVQILGTPGGDYFCRRWNSGLQELTQKNVNAASINNYTVTFSVGFTEAPHVILSPNNTKYQENGFWLSSLVPRDITATSFITDRNVNQTKTIVFTAYGRWK